MALTDNCDLFVSVLDAGVNRVFRHVQLQWPSLFNYGTANVVDNRELLCRRIETHQIVQERNFPVMTAFPLLPVDLTGTYGLDFCAQLVKAAVDFHPGTAIALPPELHPLDAQHFAMAVSVCAGIACPSAETVDALRVAFPQEQNLQVLLDRRRHESPNRIAAPRGPTQAVHARGIDCFCIDAFVEGGAIFVTGKPLPRIQGTVSGIELVDLKPDGLENAIECYAITFAKLGLLPLLSIPTSHVQDVMNRRITIAVAAPSARIPHNPAIEDNTIKVFFDVTSAPVPPGGGGGTPDPPPPPPPPPAPGVARPRIRSGPFDLTMGVSEDTVRELFAVIRDDFKLDESDTDDFGPFTFGYAFKMHLEGGTVDLRGDGTIDISEVDLKWDEAKIFFGIDLPEICVGGFCIIWTPWGCAVRAPRLCIFDDNPDLGFKLDLGGLITSEVSLNVTPVVRYSTNHPPTVNAWDALAARTPNLWQVLVRVNTTDLDPIDIADTVGDLLEAAIEEAVSAALGPLPGWATDIVMSILGPIVDVVASILDVFDDVGEWITDHLGAMDVFDIIVTTIANSYAKGSPLVSIPDPYAVDEAPQGLLPLMVPVEFVGVRVTDAELVVEADIGG